MSYSGKRSLWTDKQNNGPTDGQTYKTDYREALSHAELIYNRYIHFGVDPTNETRFIT